MEPKIVSLPAFTVVGMSYRGKNDQNQIPQLWGEFSPRMGEIQHSAGESAAYGVMYDFDQATNEFEYVAATKVTEAADLPAGMVSVEIPAAQYAVWECTLPTLQQTFQQAHAGFAQAEREHAATPEFEYYGPWFSPQDPSSAMSVYMPIK